MGLTDYCFNKMINAYPRLTGEQTAEISVFHVRRFDDFFMAH